MTYIKKFHVFEDELFSAIPFKYVLWYQEYLREKVRELGSHSDVTGPNQTPQDIEDYQFLIGRVTKVFENIVRVFEERGFSSDKFKNYRKKYRHTEYVPIISHMDCVYETAKNYRFNHKAQAAYNDISSLISSWEIAKSELQRLAARSQKEIIIKK